MRNLLFIIFLLCPLSGTAQIITTISGKGDSTESGILAIDASIEGIWGVALDRLGNIYITEGFANKILKIDNRGFLTCFAGTGVAGYSGDGGPATAAKLNIPFGIDVDSLGDVVFADGNNSVVRKIDVRTGIISTIAGNGRTGFSGDGGPATAAAIWGPAGVHIDKHGNIFFSCDIGKRIRKVDHSGIITTIAGTDTGGFTGDGGPATAAEIKAYMLTVDDNGVVYFGSPVGNSYNVIRKIDTNGIISLFAGVFDSSTAYNGDGIPATSAHISTQGLALDKKGQLYFADYYYNRIRMIDSLGIIHSIAGNGISDSTGDGGPADSASIGSPVPINFDTCGNLYIGCTSDSFYTSALLRKVTYFCSCNPLSIALSAPSTVALDSIVSVTASLRGGCCGSPDSIIWYNKGVAFSTTGSSTVTYTKTLSTDSISAKAVGCGDTTTSSLSIITTNTTGIVPLLSNQQQITCYPNPATSQIHVSTTVNIESIVITNLLGQEVYHGTPFNGNSALIDVHNLPEGVYFVKVNNIFVDKFIKE